MNRYIIMAKKLADRFEKNLCIYAELDRKQDGGRGITIARGLKIACKCVKITGRDACFEV